MGSHLLENYEEASIEKLSELTSWDQRIKFLMILDLQKLNRNSHLNENIKDRKKVLDHEQSFYNESLRLMNDSKASLIKKWNELLLKYPEAAYDEKDIEIMVQGFYSDFQKEFIRINHKYLPLQKSIFHTSTDQKEMLVSSKNNFFLTSIGIVGLLSLKKGEIEKDDLFNFLNSSDGELFKFFNAKDTKFNFQLPILTQIHREDANHWLNNYKKSILKGIAFNKFVSFEREFAINLGRNLINLGQYSDTFMAQLRLIYELRYEKAIFEVKTYPNGFYISDKGVKFEDESGDEKVLLKWP